MYRFFQAGVVSRGRILRMACSRSTEGAHRTEGVDCCSCGAVVVTSSGSSKVPKVEVDELNSSTVWEETEALEDGEEVFV